MNAVRSGRIRDLLARAAAMGGRRVTAVLLGLIALAMVGHGVAEWIIGEQRSALSAKTPDASATIFVQDLAIEPTAGAGRSASAGSRASAPAHAVERAQLGLADDLQLIGVLAAGRRSIAIIADASGAQNVYRIGDRVRAGVVLKNVSRDGAILAAGEALRYLPLERTSPAAIAMLADNRPTVPPAAAGAEQPAAATRRLPSWPSVNDPTPQMLTQGLFAPDRNGGFQLQNVKPGSVYARLGLRPGDVLRSVNGQPIDSLEQLFALHQQMNEGRQGEIEVLRDGRSQALHYGGS